MAHCGSIEVALAAAQNARTDAVNDAADKHTIADAAEATAIQADGVVSSWDGIVTLIEGQLNECESEH